MQTALTAQIILLTYHQFTTWCDLYPFNGVRHYSRSEQFAEAGTNAVLMSLAPVGFAFHLTPLMRYGVFYYFILFAIELLIWWVPYLFIPLGRWRLVYNRLLAFATSSFGPGDTLDRWIAVHQRLHADTISLLPRRPGRPTPNLEHSILHAWTLLTAIFTLSAFLSRA